MTKEQLAAKLDGREYGKEITNEESVAAKAAGLLVIFGYSDDGVQLRGVIDDEVSAYDGTTLFVSKDGKLVHELDDDDEEILEKYGVLDVVEQRIEAETKIEALWDSEPGWWWVIKTTAPHATFEIMEDGDGFCRGIVIDLADLKAVRRLMSTPRMPLTKHEIKQISREVEQRDMVSGRTSMWGDYPKIIREIDEPQINGYGRGDTTQHTQWSLITAGINVGEHMNRIECHGHTQEDAEQLRDLVLERLQMIPLKRVK